MTVNEAGTEKMKKIGVIILIQSLVFLYSLVSMLSKIAGNVMRENGMLSIPFMLLFAAMVLCMGIYAIFWQKVLQRFELSSAYVHKSMTLLWSLVWAVAVFHESIKWNNIVGILIVIAGIVMVTKND